MAENQNAADQASTLNDERATRLAKRAALFEAGFGFAFAIYDGVLFSLIS